jgi:hypothetical protein
VATLDGRGTINPRVFRRLLINLEHRLEGTQVVYPIHTQARHLKLLLSSVFSSERRQDNWLSLSRNLCGRHTGDTGLCPVLPFPEMKRVKNKPDSNMIGIMVKQVCIVGPTKNLSIWRLH